MKVLHISFLPGPVIQYFCVFQMSSFGAALNDKPADIVNISSELKLNNQESTWKKAVAESTDLVKSSFQGDMSNLGVLWAPLKCHKWLEILRASGGGAPNRLRYAS